jgi:hypothetical protein
MQGGCPAFAEGLAPGLQVNQSLTKLDMSGNKMFTHEDEDNAGINALAKALTVNSSLMDFNLAGNEIWEREIAEILASALDSNNGLTALDLSSNSIPSECVEVMQRTCGRKRIELAF